MIKRINRHVFPQYCFFHNGGIFDFRRILEITPIEKVVIPYFDVHIKNEFITTIQIPEKIFHPNCNPKNNILCKTKILGKSFNNNSINIIAKMLGDYYLNNCFRFPKTCGVEIILENIEFDENANKFETYGFKSNL